MRKFVTLPDGRYEEVKPNSVVDLCVPESEFQPIVFPLITDNTKHQANYERCRLRGDTHDESFSFAAYRAASEKLAAFKDGDIMCFVHLNPYANKVSDNFDAQVAYWRMRKNGESHKMAEMLATRTFPGVKTDAVFNEGKFSGQSTGECAPHGVWLRAQAEAAGVSTTGKWYCSGLASFPGDPTAWVDSRGDVLRIAREKNMNVHGYVEHKGHETDPGNDEEIADDIIEDEVQDILDANPFANADAVREEVYQLRTGAVDNNPLLCQDYTTTDIP